MTIRQLAFIGDSLTVGEDASASIAQGGYGTWAELVADRLANIVGLGPLLSSGIRLTSLSTAPSSEWVFTGAWSGVSSASAWDKGPYGQNLAFGTVTKFANGSSFIATWTKPVKFRPIVGFKIYWVDKTSGGNWSYRVDGGSWTAMGQTLANDNKLCMFYVATAVTSTVDIRAADASGTAVDCLPIGIEVFYQNPVGASGLIVHDIAVGATQLDALVTTTTGDRMAILGGGTDGVIKSGTGSPITAVFDAGVIMMHINDVIAPAGPNTTTWSNDLNTFITRLHAAGTPIGFMSPYRTNPASYPTTDQASYATQLATNAAAASPVIQMLDINTAWVANGWADNAAANTAGLLYTDKLHPSQAGHFDIAKRVYPWVLKNFFSSFVGLPSTYVAIGKGTSSVAGATQASRVAVAGVPISVVPV